ncbi:MAG: hypothetical protein V1750_07080 [Acidobacteriota bacterium]
MKRPLLVLLMICVAAPLVAAEAQHGESDTFLGLPRVVWYAANLIGFFGLLAYLLAKPMSQFFRTRREDISRSLAEAARQREEAVQLKAEMERKVAALAGEIESLRERLQREGERDRAQLEKQGEAEAARLLAQLDQEATRRVEAARASLAGEAAGVAAELARELLERELTPADRERLFQRALQRLGERNKGGKQ